MSKLYFSCLILTACIEVANCEDFTVPLEGGSIVIRDAAIVQGILGTELAFTATNRTSYPWTGLSLHFELDGSCNGEPRHWSHVVTTFIGWMGDPAWQSNMLTEEERSVGSMAKRRITSSLYSVIDKSPGCHVIKITDCKLLLAENASVRVDGTTGGRVDLQKQRQQEEEQRAKEQEQRAKEQVAKAEADRLATEEQAKKDAADAALQKRLAVERKKKAAEEDARLVKIKAEQDVKAAEERAKIRTACSKIYQDTIDKKVKDLTVREEQQVRTCQALDLYPPQ